MTRCDALLCRAAMGAFLLVGSMGAAHAKVPWETGIESEVFIPALVISAVVGILLAFLIAGVSHLRHRIPGRALHAAAVGGWTCLLSAFVLGVGFLKAEDHQLNIPEAVILLACLPALLAVCATVVSVRRSAASAR